MRLYLLAVRLFREGPGFLRSLSDETLYPVLKAVRHLDGEAQLLRGFVRFSELGGVLGSEIEPKNRVLPLLRSHFCARYQNETFFIYDRTHREVLLYSGGKAVITPLEQFQMSPPDETEASYRLLWKRFYDTIAIRERTNPKCRRTQMPKRYWNTMKIKLQIIEKLPKDETTPPLRYQITDGQLTRWVYSPPNYEKEPVVTEFTL